eukprot:Selendium_serpulae@DN3519_c0_g1_i1.p1
MNEIAFESVFDCFQEASACEDDAFPSVDTWGDVNRFEEPGERGGPVVVGAVQSLNCDSASVLWSDLQLPDAPNRQSCDYVACMEAKLKRLSGRDAQRVPKPWEPLRCVDLSVEE